MKQQVSTCSFHKTINSKLASRNLLNIQMDHIPINLQMSGSSEGNMRLKDKAPPNNIETYPWTSKTVYKTLPGTAGFLEAVEALGAKVAAVFWATCYTTKQTSKSPSTYQHANLEISKKAWVLTKWAPLKFVLNLKFMNDLKWEVRTQNQPFWALCQLEQKKWRCSPCWFSLPRSSPLLVPQSLFACLLHRKRHVRRAWHERESVRTSCY